MEKHKAIIFGKKVKEIYQVYSWDSQLYKRHKLLDKNIIIFEGDIDNPPLNEGDYVFIKELNKAVKIEESARNVDGGYVYWTDHVIEKISDAETEKSKVEAEQLLEKMKLEKEEYRARKERDAKWHRKLMKKLFG